jgi:hypothetical protein
MALHEMANRNATIKQFQTDFPQYEMAEGYSLSHYNENSAFNDLKGYVNQYTDKVPGLSGLLGKAKKSFGITSEPTANTVLKAENLPGTANDSNEKKSVFEKSDPWFYKLTDGRLLGVNYKLTLAGIKPVLQVISSEFLEEGVFFAYPDSKTVLEIKGTKYFDGLYEFAGGTERRGYSKDQWIKFFVNGEFKN